LFIDLWFQAARQTHPDLLEGHQEGSDLLDRLGIPQLVGTPLQAFPRQAPGHKDCQSDLSCRLGLEMHRRLGLEMHRRLGLSDPAGVRIR
ncbi:MAG: hypothetical protein LUO92_03290, partial [Methanothrix sp.]|nr:hypothetical protein [Methanothrix sp.]